LTAVPGQTTSAPEGVALVTLSLGHLLPASLDVVGHSWPGELPNQGIQRGQFVIAQVYVHEGA
jgi:hypothetical protein